MKQRRLLRGVAVRLPALISAMTRGDRLNHVSCKNWSPPLVELWLINIFVLEST